jgi:hypothetical protein
MPTTATLLLVVLVLGTILTLASTIWGLVTETSYTDDTGAKRLNKSGQAAIGLAVGSALVSTTALGMRTVADQQQAGIAAQEKAAQAANAEQAAKDDKRWKDLLSSQQAAFAKLGVEETRSQAGRVLLNQELLSALQDQRSRSIADRSRLFQIAQGQQIILQSQSLASLRVRLEFGGFTRQEFAELVKGRNEVLEYRESDDDYGRMIDALPMLDSANLLRKVVSPLFDGYFKSVDGLPEGHDTVLVVDLDGTGSWLLPIGFTAEKKANGYIFNRDWLYDAGHPYGGNSPRDGVEQNFGGCRLPAVSVNLARRTIILDWAVASTCLPTAMHRAGSANVTARMSPQPIIVLLASGEDGSPVSASNVTVSSAEFIAACADGAPLRRPGKYIQFLAEPNSVVGMRLARRLYPIGSAGALRSQLTAYDGPDDNGACLAFGP